jgi:hypothetical protein
MQKLDLEQFRALVAAGGAVGVILEATGAAFAVKIETRRGEAVLVTTNDRNKLRLFLDPRRALLMLREAGIREARIDARHWAPHQASF